MPPCLIEKHTKILQSIRMLVRALISEYRISEYLKASWNKVIVNLAAHIAFLNI